MMQKEWRTGLGGLNGTEKQRNGSGGRNAGDEPGGSDVAGIAPERVTSMSGVVPGSWSRLGASQRRWRDGAIPLSIREHSFLDSPRVPAAFKVRMRLGSVLMGPSVDELLQGRCRLGINTCCLFQLPMTPSPSLCLSRKAPGARLVLHPSAKGTVAGAAMGGRENSNNGMARMEVPQALDDVGLLDLLGATDADHHLGTDMSQMAAESAAAGGTLVVTDGSNGLHRKFKVIHLTNASQVRRMDWLDQHCS